MSVFLPAPAPVPVLDLSLERLGEPALAFAVAGDPAPQGSKKAFVRKSRTGRLRVNLVESSTAVVPWRSAVAAASLQARGPGFRVLDGPLVADVVLTRPRPASLPKRGRSLPDRRPDLSKLLRSTEDALDTDAGVIADDARIVAFRRLAKFYVGDTDPDALGHPGVVVRLWPYPTNGSGAR